MKKSFWSKPITWGGYAKLCIIATVAGAIMVAVEYVCLFTEFPGKIRSWFQNKFHKEACYEEE